MSYAQTETADYGELFDIGLIEQMPNKGIVIDLSWKELKNFQREWLLSNE